MTKPFDHFFETVTGGSRPHDWQHKLGGDAECRDRLIRIPTGFGKTAGVVLTWLYHRVVRGDESWPRRLVFCLPMRVLVEQTEGAIRDWVERAGVGRVDVHVLMGGVKAARWVVDPDAASVLVGTQDMLLSRALNRGYAAARGLWPMEFGLLHQDALWVLDEVQLMDVGLATSAQLAAFRQHDADSRAPLRPTHTWWMSATLQPRWLRTVDRAVPEEPPLAIPADARRGGLFEVKKTLGRRADVAAPQEIAAIARERHRPGALTLVIVNRVRDAIDVYDALDHAYSEGKGKKRARVKGAPDLRLVHSRFRGHERELWRSDFLHREAPVPADGRIVVATQIVEAGVDVSAATLVTQLAPWSSLVQRFGRAARYEGESAEIVVVGAVPDDDGGAAPYTVTELGAADDALTRLLAGAGDGGPRALETFEEELARDDAAALARLYPYAPMHVLRRRDLDDLFDTSADLSGADIDVSRFIRSGDERDVSVFWRPLEPTLKGVILPGPPQRRELCPVPIADIKAWKHDAYALDYLDGVWVRRDVKRLMPGMVILLDQRDGGYSTVRGWDPKSKSTEPPSLEDIVVDALGRASAFEDTDDLSVSPWKTIATHGRETEEQARDLCVQLGIDPDLARVVSLAARWHDVGKAHPVFQDAIRASDRDGVRLGARRDLAKAPDEAWRRPPYPERPGFRHELASTLALFELLRRHDPDHPALLGPYGPLLEAIGCEPERDEAPMQHPLAEEIAGLGGADFDLLAWLVCTHHGKVRCVWTSSPRDQEAGHGGIHGVCENDALHPFHLTNADGAPVELPALSLSLAAAELGVGTRYGASWSERVAGLLARFGPFTLAYLEAILRAADWRATRLATEDTIA